MTVEYFHKPVYFTMMVTEFFKFMVFSFLENPLNQGIFQHALLPSHNSPPKPYHYPPIQAERNYSFLPGSVFFLICSSQQQKGVEETIICFDKMKLQNSINTTKFYSNQ